MIERSAAVERDQKKPECPKRTHEVVLNRDVAVSCPRQRVFTPVANAIIKKYRAL